MEFRKSSCARHMLNTVLGMHGHRNWLQGSRTPISPDANGRANNTLNTDRQHASACWSAPRVRGAGGLA